MSEYSAEEDKKGGLELVEATPEVKQPPMYQVLLIDDEFTPMEFVVKVLVIYFFMNHAKARRIMWQVHTLGKGVCGVYTRDIAETKVSLVTDFARANQYPLLCKMEPLK